MDPSTVLGPGSAATPVRHVRAHRAQKPIDAKPFHAWVLPDGTPWANFYRAGKHYLLRFPALADFAVVTSGLEVAIHPVPGACEQTVEHLYLNQVLPLAMSRQLKLVLHASAVEVGSVAVAFVGASGRGKSTLAASFATRGYRFLADDGLQLEKLGGGYLVQPSHASIRLWDDSHEELIPDATRAAPAVAYTGKMRVLADDQVAFGDIPRPLRCVYFLGEGEGDEISIHPAGGRDAVIELVRHSFLLDIEARDMLTHHFEQLTELARLPLCFRLDFPRRYGMLPSVRDAVTRHVRGA